MSECIAMLQEKLGGTDDCYSQSVVAAENKKRLEIKGPPSEYCRIKVDDCLIKNATTMKCDYVFVRCSPEQFLFVELKGSKIERAHDQIIETIKHFKTKMPLRKDQICAYVVSSAVPASANQKFQVLQKKFASEHGVSLKRTTNQAILKGHDFCGKQQ